MRNLVLRSPTEFDFLDVSGVLACRSKLNEASLEHSSGKHRSIGPRVLKPRLPESTKGRARGNFESWFRCLLYLFLVSKIVVNKTE